MKPNKQNELYANLMDEVKVRIDAINYAAQGFIRLPTPIVREFCYLQLRLLCELIALSCLVAHGDITFLQPHKLGRSYSAEDIFERLTKLREHFYPVAVKQTPKDGGIRGFNLEGINPSPLDKHDLLKLYGHTHKHLHRGSLKKLLESATPIDITINMPEIVGWAQKINDLLACHLIAINEDKVIICMLRNADDNFKVQVATAERPTEPL
jgi:hypothetical protein